MSCRDRLNAVGIFVGNAKYIAIFQKDFPPKRMMGVLFVMLVPCDLGSVAATEEPEVDN